MTTQYIVWISIEKCEGDHDEYDRIETVGEPRQAGGFRNEQSAWGTGIAIYACDLKP